MFICWLMENKKKQKKTKFRYALTGLKKVNAKN